MYLIKNFYVNPSHFEETRLETIRIYLTLKLKSEGCRAVILLYHVAKLGKLILVL